MATIHTTANRQHLDTEAHIVHETNKNAAKQAQDSKKSRGLLVIHSLLILITVSLVLCVLFWPDLLGNVLSAVTETLNSWRDRLSDYILMPESRERPDNALGMVWLGILLALDWVLRMLGKILLFLLVWTSPILIVGGMILIAFLIIRHSCRVIGDNRQRKQKKEEIKDNVTHSLPKEMAKIYNDSQSNRRALAILSDLCDECHIFTNLDIPCDGESCTGDIVVVSPSGVTVIDVRSDSGLFFGDLSEKTLVQWEHRNTKNPKEKSHAEKKVPNPIKELGAQVHNLARYLKDRDISVYVQSCVLFASEEVQLHVTDHNGLAKNCPLFLINAPELLNYLHSAERVTLSPAMIRQIVAAFKEESHGKHI